MISGPTTPRKMRIGISPMRAPQSGMTNSDVISRISFQICVEGVGDAHAGILPDGGRPRRGLPFLVVAPRPGDQPGSGRGSSIAAARPAWADACCRPTATASLGRSSRPRSQAAPAVRAPRSVEAGAQRVVVGHDEDPARGHRRRPGSPGPRRRASAAGRRPSGRPAWRTMTPAAMRWPRSPRSGAPSKMSSMPIVAGHGRRAADRAAAAGGAAPARCCIAWSRFVPSTSRRSVAVERVARAVGHARHRTRRPGRGYDRAA